MYKTVTWRPDHWSATITRQYGQETQLSLTNRAMRLEVSQGHQTWYHSICYVWFHISVL